MEIVTKFLLNFKSKQQNFTAELCISTFIKHRGSSVVKVLCYKSESRCFDSRWCYWKFTLT